MFALHLYSSSSEKRLLFHIENAFFCLFVFCFFFKLIPGFFFHNSSSYIKTQNLNQRSQFHICTSSDGGRETIKNKTKLHSVQSRESFLAVNADEYLRVSLKCI